MTPPLASHPTVAAALVRPAHIRVDPGILYFGTPVVLLCTVNPEGSTNVAPISSVFWLDHRAMLGVGRASQTWANLARTGELTLCLPSTDQADAVDALALTTGRSPVPERKRARGYRHESDKLAVAGLTARESVHVDPPGLAETPVHMEARVISMELADERVPAIEVEIVAVHVRPDLLVDGTTDHIDPDRWRPLIMSFQQFYGLGERIRPSRLATIPEELYR